MCVCDGYLDGMLHKKLIHCMFLSKCLNCIHVQCYMCVSVFGFVWVCVFEYVWVCVFKCVFLCGVYMF